MRALITALITAVLLLPSTTAAQPACELTPLALPLFDATPLAMLATPAATPASAPLTEGEANDILEKYVACTNTGNPTLVWAMFTPRWFSTEFADSETHYLPAFEQQIANTQDLITDPLELVSIDEIKLQDDGRVAIIATFSSADQTWTDQLILANIDGQWLIDEVEMITPTS